MVGFPEGETIRGGRVTRPSIDSRTQIVERLRAANGSAALDREGLAQAYDALPRQYIRQGKLSPSAKIDLLIERLREYDADVVESTPEMLPATIGSRLAASRRKTFVVPSGAPSAWRIAGFDWKIDAGLDIKAIEDTDGVVTGASYAIADSGTIVLHHTAEEGRRVLTLLPDWHLCILRTSQVVETLPEYFASLKEPPQLVTWISGPSATADIEMTRIKGVHGPRFLNVILVCE